MLGIALALAASVSWGISDFIGGLMTRRSSALSVLIGSQPVGLVLALGFAVTIGGNLLPADDFLLAASGGVAMILALAIFYRAMALGSMSVVTTIGTLGIVIPVVYGLAGGEEPTALQAVGAVIAIPAVMAVAHDPDPEWRAANRHSIGLAALAAFGFGIYLTIIDATAESDPPWTIVAIKVGSVALLGVATLWARPGLPAVRGGALAAVLAIGVFDVLANTLYAYATTNGILPLVAVAGSFYAAVTVLLARVVLGERLAPTQRLGFVFALVGVGLIAAGA